MRASSTIILILIIIIMMMMLTRTMRTFRTFQQRMRRVVWSEPRGDPLLRRLVPALKTTRTPPTSQNRNPWRTSTGTW